MQTAAIKKLIKGLFKWLPEIVFVLVLGAVVGLAYRSGFQTAYAEQQAVIEKMKADAAKKEAEAAKAHVEQLEKIQAQAVEMNRLKEDIEIRTVTMTNETNRHKAENKKGIEDAITQDRNENRAADGGGLGTHSLRQYRKSLGYDG